MAKKKKDKCDLEDIGAGFFCRTHRQMWQACREDGHYKV